MTPYTITDANTFLNTQIAEHTQLSEQLSQIQHLVDFTASSDLKNPDPLQLIAQLIAIEKTIKEAEALNQRLQSAISQHKERFIAARTRTVKIAG